MRESINIHVQNNTKKNNYTVIDGHIFLYMPNLHNIDVMDIKNPWIPSHLKADTKNLLMNLSTEVILIEINIFYNHLRCLDSFWMRVVISFKW